MSTLRVFFLHFYQHYPSLVLRSEYPAYSTLTITCFTGTIKFDIFLQKKKNQKEIQTKHETKLQVRCRPDRRAETRNAVIFLSFVLPVLLLNLNKGEIDPNGYHKGTKSMMAREKRNGALHYPLVNKGCFLFLGVLLRLWANLIPCCPLLPGEPNVASMS